MGVGGYEHLIGGISGGFVSTLVCHPLDLLKIRYSVNDKNVLRPQYRSYWHAAQCIIKAEGFRGLYQGLTPNILASPLSWGLYFQLYHQIHGRFDFLSKSVSHSFQNLIVGCVTGASVMAVTNPFWVAKTRLCLQYENEAVKSYRGMGHCLRKILQEEGIKGWYRGFVPALFGTLNGAIQFAIYNYLKDWRYKSKGLPSDASLGTLDYFAFSSISKVLSTASTYPYQVIRARLQDHHTHYKSSRDVMYHIVRKEGFTGFYKGMFMATLKQLPNGVVTYVVYEHARKFAEQFA